MPWLGLADVRVAFLERAARQDGASDAGIVYRAMREEMWRRLATPESLSPAKADLAGSIWFGPDGGISPIATSIQSRPVVFVAAMLGDLEMTPSAEAGIETARLLAALRYLRQLTVDDASAWMYPDPARAMGGVRTSVWDQRLAPEATAMTLLAVHETLRTFDLLERRSR
jgi:hypothetical protein